ncbi:MAG TPA: tyrosine--tRNA ligase [Candidatus Paceibacterota bacterium]|nr:tyrosine--tRNA ligase [Candidatus Paceibacterota bacterium]HPQ22773.1 tyrosine--tRNA ligase [Candidatus Paceibacterota bacterium]
MDNILDDLKFRGLINQATNLEGLKKRLKKGKIVLYCGFDPTAQSLHIGNLLPLVTLKRFQRANHQPIFLIGGGTGLIGDPSGKNLERPLSDEELVKQWKKKIVQQVSNIFSGNKNSVIVVDNYEWLSKQKIIYFLRDIGRHFTVPYMLAKESVKNRLNTGISFTEFSYMILQAFDFYYLNQNYHCELQIGGSDQWGNITAGIELIKKKTGQEVFGLSLPLVTKADGTKFGKTESGTIWLDPQLTSPYQFYQFWFNTDDKDVEKFLKFYTFLTEDEIKELELKTKKMPEKRLAQKVLALEITALVHGKKLAQQSEKISQSLFYDNLENLSLLDLKTLFQSVEIKEIPKKKEILILDFLLVIGACSSKSEARRELENGIIKVNGQKVDLKTKVNQKMALFGQYFIVQKGKKQYYFGKMVP